MQPYDTIKAGSGHEVCSVSCGVLYKYSLTRIAKHMILSSLMELMNVTRVSAAPGT